MCGIAGIVSLDGFDPQVLVDMTHLVTHRGPDGFGFAYGSLASPNDVEIIHNENRFPRNSAPLVGLGSRRLAILDLTHHGDMPLRTDDGSCCITYNGEIYNYREIRVDLENLGVRFHTGTDTEVLLQAYRAWGEECLQRFNGMFSFAIWDQATRSLFCARDRFGVKPFYYFFDGRRFYFGSELKQLIHGAGLPRVANARTVYHFLEQCLFDYSENTFFENIYQLRGGHCLRLGLTEPLELSVRRYWDLRIEPEPLAARSEDDLREEFRHRWQESLRLRLRSDVPVGASLSGGIDSSAVVCEASRQSPGQTFHTFSACAEDRQIDEREFASAVVQSIGGSPHLTFPKLANFWEDVQKLAYHQDEPIQSGGVYAQWCVMAEARKQRIPVLLGGQGGDEALCGYQKYRYFYLWGLLRRGNPRVFRETLMSLRNGTKRRWALSDASRYFPAPLRGSFSTLDRYGDSAFVQEFQGRQLSIGAADSIADRQKMDLTFSSIPALLHIEDRNSMAHSIESRLPFLDYKLVEFAVNCPTSLKLRDGWSKWILRDIMKGVMPESVRLRKSKLAFDVPQDDWMRSGLTNGHRDLWETPKLRMARFLNPSLLATEMKRFLAQQKGALSCDQLFRAVSLELWARVHDVS